MSDLESKLDVLLQVIKGQIRMYAMKLIIITAELTCKIIELVFTY